MIHFAAENGIRNAARMIKRQYTDCGRDRGFCSNKSTWIGFWLKLSHSQAIKMIGFGLEPIKKKMGFLQRKFHIDWLQLSYPTNQNDRV